MPRPGSTAARGYGAEHQRLRAALRPYVEAGGLPCARCGQPIRPWQDWDLGHNDHDRSRYQGPEHSSCNRGRRARDAGYTTTDINDL